MELESLSLKYFIEQSVSFPMLLFIVYFFTLILHIFIHKYILEVSVFPSIYINLYFMYIIVGFAVLVSISGTQWMYASKYSVSINQRYKRISIGFVFLFIFHDLPMFIILLFLFMNHTVSNIFQIIDFTIVSIEFIASLIITWISYSWTIAKELQKYFEDSTAIQEALRNKLENRSTPSRLTVEPYATASPRDSNKFGNQIPDASRQVMGHIGLPLGSQENISNQYMNNVDINRPFPSASNTLRFTKQPFQSYKYEPNISNAWQEHTHRGEQQYAIPSKVAHLPPISQPF